jgi:hypothetical protein
MAHSGHARRVGRVSAFRDKADKPQRRRERPPRPLPFHKLSFCEPGGRPAGTPRKPGCDRDADDCQIFGGKSDYSTGPCPAWATGAGG